MAVSLAPANLKRYKDLAWLLVKYGRSDLVRGIGLEAGVESEASGSADSTGEDLAKDLEKLGPSFIKLGQILSTRPDLLPPEYLEPLARLQDRVEPFSFGDVEKIVAEELGVRISKAFSEFERPRSRPRRSDRCTGHGCATAGRSRSRSSDPASGSRSRRISRRS